MIAARKLHLPLKWHGGKHYQARRIIAEMGPHAIYVEPCLGGGSVLFNKERSRLECAGDLDPNLMRFWGTLQGDLGPDLIGLIRETPYNRGMFEAAQAFWGGQVAESDGSAAFVATPVLFCWAFLVRNRMSRGGLGRDFAWSDRLRGKRRPGGPVPGDVNAWESMLADLDAVRERLRGVELFCLPMEELIRMYRGFATALIYLDPPYLMETRTHKRAYAVEAGVTERDSRMMHQQMLALCRQAEAQILISGYPSKLYDDELGDWDRFEFFMPNHSGQGRTKQRRTEVVWRNRRPEG